MRASALLVEQARAFGCRLSASELLPVTDDGFERLEDEINRIAPPIAMVLLNWLFVAPSDLAAESYIRVLEAQLAPLLVREIEPAVQETLA